MTGALGIPRTTQEQPDGVINLDFPLLAAKQLFAAKVIFWQPVNPNEVFEDIAGLELETALPDTAQPAQLVTSEDLWGHPFRVLGFPAGQPNGVSASGVLRSRIANGWVQLEDVKQAGYRLEPGFSGAPVWDEELQGVAGMAVAAEMNRVDVKAAFIIPTSILVNAWSDLGEQAIPSCPYRGLFAFREQDAKFFFGREKFTEQLVAAVQRQQLVVVIGSSGSGKSSVVFAGLVPQLRQQGDWLINSFRPGERPLRNLAAALVPLLETQMSETDQLVEINKLAMAFGEGNITLQDVVTRILEKHSSTRLLLVADQFEELYTLCKDVEEIPPNPPSKGGQRQLFLARLLEGLNNSPNFHLVLTLRADFLGYALSYRPFADALQNADVKLGPMNRQELQDAIAKPAQMLGVRIEEGLTERILEAVENSPGNLPLLEFALTQLWAKQRNGQLTHDAYEEIGGVEKALASYAEEVYRRLSEVDRHVVQRVFIQLVRPGEGTEDTRRLATRAEVGEDNWDLVTRLADVRLVVTGQDEGVGEETVEIVHEALIREWGRLRGWMESDRRFRTWQERLRAAMRQWEATGKDDGALLRGAPLAEAEAWQQRRLGELSPEERVFIQLSLALRDREKKERERLRQRMTLGLVSGLIITTTLALFTAQRWQLAEAQLGKLAAERDREHLIKQIAQLVQIPRTEGFLVKNLAVTEDSVWMTIYKSEYEGDAEGAGLLRYDLKTKALQRFRAGDSSGLRGNLVTALFSDGKDIWVGVEMKGWRGVQHGSHRTNGFKFTESLPVTPLILDLVRDRHQNLWVLTLDGLCKSSANKCQIVQDSQPLCPNLASSPWKPRVRQMVIDPAGSTLWIGTTSNIIQWPLEGKTALASCYIKEDGLKQQSASQSKSVKALAFDSRNRLWVATADRGVSRFSKNTETLKWRAENQRTDIFAQDDIEILAKLPNELMLAGTKNYGLFLYHPATDKWSNVPIASREVQTIYDIFLDSHSHLWLATNRGLFYSEQPIQPVKNDNVSLNITLLNTQNKL